MADISTLTVEPPAKEPIPIHPIHVSGMAYAKVIDGMMNVGFYLDQSTPDGGSERVIVAKLIFPARPTTVARALVVNHAMLEGAMRERQIPANDGRSRRFVLGRNALLTRLTLGRNLAKAVSFALISRAIRRTKTQKHETRLRQAGRCPAKPGISRCGSPDTPRKAESLQVPFLAAAELCPQIVRALRRDLIPNGEAMSFERLSTNQPSLFTEPESAGASPAPRVRSARSANRAAWWEQDLSRTATYLMGQARSDEERAFVEHLK